MTNTDRQSAAYHEAGHAVVGWSLGLEIGQITIGDEANGQTQIASDQEHLSMIDRLAICLAGIEAQEVFQCPTHDLAGLTDLGNAQQIIGMDVPDDESRTLCDAGYQRARELIVLHMAEVVQLANYLIMHGGIEHGEFRFAIKIS
jgi:ATP-dependent Zn protease